MGARTNVSALFAIACMGAAHAQESPRGAPVAREQLAPSLYVLRGDITAHESARERLAHDNKINVVLTILERPAFPRAALPIVTFTDPLELVHAAPAHTAGDVAVIPAHCPSIRNALQCNALLRNPEHGASSRQNESDA
jgi:hypothetical protein